MTEDYRVNLDIYNGPMDLLLYLIRREEVDIYDIPIARITRQYIEYVDVIKALEPNTAGEFLLTASLLMEIKSRMLLPAPEAGEDGADGLDVDPRADLVRQLLQYKAFKDAATDLEEAAAEQAMRFPRAPAAVPAGDEQEIDLEDVQVWDLFDAFSKIMEAIGHRQTSHEVIYDDTPVELWETDILDRLQREGAMTFRRIFEGRTNRSEVIGLFLAVLELIRQKKIRCAQGRNFGEIDVQLAPEGSEAPADTAPRPDESLFATDEPAADPAPPTTPDAPEGTYVSDPPAPPAEARPWEHKRDTSAEDDDMDFIARTTQDLGIAGVSMTDREDEEFEDDDETEDEPWDDDDDDEDEDDEEEEDDDDWEDDDDEDDDDED